METADGQIDANDRNHFALLVMDRVRAADYHRPRARIVQIGLGPPSAVNRESIIEPLGLEIVVVLITYLTRVYARAIAGRDPAAAYLIPAALGGIIIRDERHSGALHIIQCLNQGTRAGVHALRVIQAKLHHVGQHLRRRLQFRSRGIDLQLSSTQFSTRPILRLMLDRCAAVEILKTSRCL